MSQTHTSTSSILTSTRHHFSYAYLSHVPVSDDVAVCFRSLWLHQLNTGRSVQLLRDARFASYSVLAVSPDGLWVLLGSVTGWLRVLTTRGQGVDGEGEDKHCIDSQP